MTRDNSLIGWYGGKYNLAKHFLPFPEHTTYIEVFGGSAVALYKKEPSPYEVVNDINSRLINMWKVVQSDRRKFKDYCENEGGVDSRQLFDEFKENIAGDPVEDAMRFFYINHHSFSQMNESYHGLSFTGKDHWHSTYMNKLQELDLYAERIKNVKFECYDEQTEILTTRGFIPFKKLRKHDNIATLDDGIFKWSKPERIVKYHYKGEMVKITHRSVDLLVTPNHKMYVRKRGQDKYEFHEADKLKQFHTINSVDWQGKEKDKYKQFKMDDWLNFLGWYVSDGFVLHEPKNGQYNVYITQTKEENLPLIEDCLNRLGFKWWRNQKNYVISNKELWKILKPLGYAKDKYIPRIFLELSKRQIWILFKSLIKGDGHFDGKRYYYSTVSKKLASQIQELMTKLGFSSSLQIRNDGFKPENDLFVIQSRMNKECEIDHRKHISKEYYDGMVYCCTVPSHVILVRRNGKVTWCGNCQDFRTLMKRADKEGVLFFLDPPYFKGGDLYGNMAGMEEQEWSQKDFEDLREILFNLKHAKFVLTVDDDGTNYYSRPDWHVQEVERINAASLCVGGEKSRDIELVIRNFDPKTTPTMKRYSIKDKVGDDMTL